MATGRTKATSDSEGYEPNDHDQAPAWERVTVAHRRRPLVNALALNTAALVVEVGAGIPAKSLSLVMDGVHNISR